MAATAPRIIELIDKKITIDCHSFIIFANGMYINLTKIASAATFGINAKKAVTEVGDPS